MARRRCNWTFVAFHVMYYRADTRRVSACEADGSCISSDILTGENHRMMKIYRFFVLNSLVLVLMCAMIIPAQSAKLPEVMQGEASYYANSLHGNKTASGEPYDKGALTAAHRSLPFGTKVKVTYLKTGKSVVVVINDRGPHVKNRIIDLSEAAANEIGLIEDGHGKVGLEIYKP